MNYGIIVDGYSSGAELVHEFKKLGIPCIHVQSKEKIPDVYNKTFNKSAYVRNYVFDENSNNQELFNELSHYPPLFAITGSEPGVEVADIIANRFNLNTHNPIDTTLIRRDKFLMGEQLKKAGLAYIPQFKSSICADILQWSRNLSKWPLVIKPLKSAGGDKVRVCYSEKDIIRGFDEIVNDKPNMLNLIDREVLIQEYIEAPEYAVNTVQFDGVPYLNEVVQFHKTLLENGKTIYNYAQLIPYNQCPPLLREYAFKVANILNIKFGPMHAEIFMTKSGPVLIEAAARLMGANIPSDLMKACVTHPQAYMTVLAYAKPKEFLSKIRDEPHVKKNLRIVFLISSQSGKLNKINYLDKIQELKSFYAIKLRVTDNILQTVDYDSSPGLIYLYHEDEEVLEKDFLTIRELEKNKMYELAT